MAQKLKPQGRTPILCFDRPAKYEYEVASRTWLPGVGTDLAWMPVGSNILFIEATKVSGHGKLILTGQLGDAMKENTQAALTSLFTNRPIAHDIAMTGKISLQGLVLPVRGIKEKVLAAQRAGIKTVLLPARNQKDLRDVPDAVQSALKFIQLDTVDEAVRAALT